MELIIGNTIALVASLLMVYSGIIKQPKKIVYIQSIQVGLLIFSNLILNGIPGAILNVFCFIRNILCYKKKLGIKEKIIISILSITLTLYFNNLEIIGIVPLVSVIVYLWFMTIKDVFKFKLLLIFTIALWAVYDYSIKAYTACFFDIFTILANILSIKMLKKGNQ